ncbi:MFS transporter [Novosphingobium umbonatum]|nr:MFS transporter [Novosphingobium umbonatum]
MQSGQMPLVQGRKVLRGGWYALALVSATQCLSLLDRNILAILSPRIKHDLAIGDAEMGLLYGTVFALFYALFSLPLGRLADGWRRTWLLACCIALWSMATGLAGLASGFALLALSRLGVGIGEAASQPAGTSLIFDYFPKARRGLAMAVLAAAIAIGLGLSSVLGGMAADWWDGRFPGAAPFALKGWQFAFILAALPGLPLALLLWRLREPERGAADGIPTVPEARPFAAAWAVLGAVLPVSNWWLMARRGAEARVWAVNLGGSVAIVLAMVAAARMGAAFSPRPLVHLGLVSLSPHDLQWIVVGVGLFAMLNLMQSQRLVDPPAYAVMCSPSLRLSMLAGSLQSMINYGCMAFTPAFLMKVYHLSPAQAGLQFGLLSAGLGVVGPMVAGPLTDWANQRLPGLGRVLIAIFAMGGSPLLAIWVYHAPDAGSFYARFVAYSFVLTMWMPPLYAVLYDQVLPRMRGMTSSTYLVVSTITGLGIGPYIVGMISDASGGDLGRAILSINWVAVPLVAVLVALAMRVRRDEALVVERAREAGEPV